MKACSIETRTHGILNVDLEQADRIAQRLWDKDVKPWHRFWVPIFRRFARDLVRDAEISSGKIVLDVGTGTGVAAMEAAKRVKPGGFVVGLDRSVPMLTLAESVYARTKIKNVLFFKMDSRQMCFPGELFDIVLSNCGTSYATFRRTISEVFRVLREGGYFAFNDWHLKDVPAHKTFSEVLQRSRTDHPTARLRIERAALATLERMGSRYLNVNEQVRELQVVGFDEIQVKHRNYTIRLESVEEYLDMRLERAPLKHELQELSRAQRAKFMDELRRELKGFVRNGRFTIDWKVAFIKAKKPNNLTPPG